MLPVLISLSLGFADPCISKNISGVGFIPADLQSLISKPSKS